MEICEHAQPGKTFWYELLHTSHVERIGHLPGRAAAITVSPNFLDEKITSWSCSAKTFHFRTPVESVKTTLFDQATNIDHILKGI